MKILNILKKLFKKRENGFFGGVKSVTSSVNFDQFYDEGELIAPIRADRVYDQMPRIETTGRTDAGYAMPSGTTLASLSAYTRTTDTITASANGAFPTIDTGVTPTAGNVVMLWQEPDARDNGPYTITTTGDGSNPWVATRAVRTNGQNPLGYTFTPYPTIGSAYGPGSEKHFLCTTDGTVNTDELTWVPVPYTALPFMYDADDNLLIICQSGKTVKISPRDGFTIQGGTLDKQGSTSFTIPGSGRFLAPEVSESTTMTSNNTFTIKQREEYINVGTVGGTAIDVSFTIPENARLQAVFLTLDSVTGAATYDFGWSDASTAFATGVAVGTDTVVNQSGTVQRTGSAGTLRITGNATFTAGTIIIGAVWSEATNSGSIFYNP